MNLPTTLQSAIRHGVTTLFALLAIKAATLLSPADAASAKTAIAGLQDPTIALIATGAAIGLRLLILPLAAKVPILGVLLAEATGSDQPSTISDPLSKNLQAGNPGVDNDNKPAGGGGSAALSLLLCGCLAAIAAVALTACTVTTTKAPDGTTTTVRSQDAEAVQQDATLAQPLISRLLDALSPAPAPAPKAQTQD